jgi:ABC-type antimicrobial peptide transport system permease subunit
VLARIFLLCSAGGLTGALLALAAGKVLSVVLYGVSPRDPTTYLAALLIVAGVALLACWQPALRAIRIDPALTLREE